MTPPRGPFSRLFAKPALVAGGREAGDAALLSRADELRDLREWAEAVQAYEAFLTQAPQHVAAWVQYGHALKEDGRVPDAVEAYRQAIALWPTDADAHLQLGHALKLNGQIPEAIESYRLAFELAPEEPDARAELITLGARELVGAEPERQHLLYGVVRELQDLKDTIARLEKRLPALEDFAAIPVSHHQDFRTLFEVVGDPGPAGLDGGGFAILIAADDDEPAQLAATLRSIIGQTREDWTVLVLAHGGLMRDRAATHADRDPRISFVTRDQGAAVLAGPLDEAASFVLCLRAGTVLTPNALAWFAAVLTRTAASAAICDYDHVEPGPKARPRFTDPRLLWAFEVDGLLQSDDLLQSPVFTRQAWDGPAFHSGLEGGWEDSLRLALLRAREAGAIAHIPRLLASRPSALRATPAAPSAAVLAAIGARVEPRDGAWVTHWPAREPTEAITVIVPTRDRLDLLSPCIDSLRTHAANLAAIEIVVVDNGSADPATLAALEGYQARGEARVLRVDETFSWSRLNNLAVAGVKGILLFVNDDVRMLTPAWDDLLRGYVQRPDVGVVGARLVYPDMRLQHAGVALGVDETPRHEGVGRPLHDRGPAGRWAVTRPAAAVTGAFLAVKGEAFSALGGFDEVNMPIAYSDIDFCLKARAAGRTVLYAPALTLIHAESQSRGFNRTPRERSWEDDESAALRARWGEGMDWDPTMNPYWRPVGRPLETLRAPGQELVWAWIEQSVTSSPWGVPGLPPGKALT